MAHIEKNRESAINNDDDNVSNVVEENLNSISGGGRSGSSSKMRGTDLFPAQCFCTHCGFNWNAYVCDKFMNRPVCPKCKHGNWWFWKNVQYQEVSEDGFEPTDLTNIVDRQKH